MVGLPLAKECLGFAGTVLILVPWVRDYAGRRIVARLRRLRARGSLEPVVAAVVAHRQAWLADPKPLDLALTVAGLVLVAASFVIGVVLTIGG